MPTSTGRPTRTRSRLPHFHRQDLAGSPPTKFALAVVYEIGMPQAVVMVRPFSAKARSPAAYPRRWNKARRCWETGPLSTPKEIRKERAKQRQYERDVERLSKQRG